MKCCKVQFKHLGKRYYFGCDKIKLQNGDKVIVQTIRGTELGEVVGSPFELTKDEVQGEIKDVLRKASESDLQTYNENKSLEPDIMNHTKELVKKHKLEMKLVEAEYTFDNNKLLFYFTADGRIDFRELVKDLAAVFRTRIELRQIGVRDETKILGGIGICGRELCCKSYLADFAPVSIKMAKEQNLSLNPTKISGVCGRLMCCLKNEAETYEYLNSRLPNVGDTVTTIDGCKGEVQSINVLRQLVKVLIEVNDEKELREYEVERLKFKPRRRKEKSGNVEDKALKELEAMDKKTQRQYQTFSGRDERAGSLRG